MTEYRNVKMGKLKLKGEKTKKHKSKKRKHEDTSLDSHRKDEDTDSEEMDVRNHGGWWRVSASHQLKGNIAIQMGNIPVYISALDDGLFTVGAPHDEGDGPSPEEVLTVVPSGDPKKLSMKSGYGKYVGVDDKGRLVGRAEAIGPREIWMPVFQDGQTALLSANDCFLTVDEDDNIVATSTTAGKGEMIIIRCNALREKDKKQVIPDEEKGSLKDVEVNYIKKFQKFQDKRLRVNSEGVVELKAAKQEGKLHEALLDRRSKMKADRYCK